VNKLTTQYVMFTSTSLIEYVIDQNLHVNLIEMNTITIQEVERWCTKAKNKTTLHLNDKITEKHKGKPKYARKSLI
jgi:hypothetical protein